MVQRGLAYHIQILLEGLGPTFLMLAMGNSGFWKWENSRVP